MPSPPDRRSIGQVLAALKSEFPDISISKIRFLEAEGLLAPERAPSGYRRYAAADIERLRYVLSVQRDHYLPLRVIREHLEQIDRGSPPPVPTGPHASGSASPPDPPGACEPSPGAGTGPASPAAAPPSGGSPSTVTSPAAAPSAPPALKQPLRLTRADLIEASGLTEQSLTELERTGIVVPKRGTSAYGREALTLAIAARRLGEYGVDGRHLRAFKMSADREVGLVEQAIAPYVRRAGANQDVAGEVTQLVISFHAALVRLAMER